MKILIACEESQTVTKAFRELGYEAYSCDIQDCSGGHPEWHIKGDAITEAYSGKYDMMIAHPPCTFMSKAGARWMHGGGVVNQERLAKALEAKEFFMKLWYAPIQFIVLENPQPLKIVGLPEPTQIIQPYHFGDPFSKKTYLWISGLPNLIHTNVLTEYKPFLPSNTGGAKRGQKFTYKSITQKESSVTFKGIANAIAKQYGSYAAGFREDIYAVF